LVFLSLLIFGLVAFTAPAQASASGSLTNPTHFLAYTDPGSGAMLWQLLLSSGMLLGFYYSRARKWVSSILKTKDREEHTDALN
jgi:hypothetical protein